MTDAHPETSPGMLDADLLSVFCRVAQTRNFSRAANHLGVAQPIVTRKIKRLEEELGVQLFVRSNRGCELTQEGELLASKASGILLQLTQLRDEVSTSADRLSGTIAVGVPIAAGMLLAPHIMPCIANRWPQLRVELYESVSHGLLKSVLNREMSLALLFDPPPDLDLIVRPLLMERLHLLGPPSAARKFAELKQANIRDLLDLPLVLPVRSQIIRVLLEDAFAEEGRPLIPRYEANNSLLLKAMVAQGLGFGVASAVSADEDVAAGRIVAIPFADRGMSITLTLVTTREHARLRSVQLMSELLVSEVRRLAKAGLWPGSPQIMRS